MSRQKFKNDIIKSSWTAASNIKDVISRNIVKAVASKEVNVPREQLNKLIMLLQASVDEAFESSLKNFKKELDKCMTEAFPEEVKKTTLKVK